MGKLVVFVVVKGRDEIGVRLTMFENGARMTKRRSSRLGG